MNPRQFIESARRIKRLLVWKNGSKSPRSLRAWRLLCAEYGIEIVEMPCPGFKARLVLTPEGTWHIFYNPGVSLRQRRKYLCHELAEYIARADYPSLFDGLPGTPGIAYDGGGSPDDFRHRLARQVERLFFRK